MARNTSKESLKPSPAAAQSKAADEEEEKSVSSWQAEEEGAA
jgi:hypothetical protein